MCIKTENIPTDRQLYITVRVFGRVGALLVAVGQA